MKYTYELLDWIDYRKLIPIYLSANPNAISILNENNKKNYKIKF